MSETEAKLDGIIRDSPVVTIIIGAAGHYLPLRRRSHKPTRVRGVDIVMPGREHSNGEFKHDHSITLDELIDGETPLFVLNAEYAHSENLNVDSLLRERFLPKKLLSKLRGLMAPADLITSMEGYRMALPSLLGNLDDYLNALSVIDDNNPNISSDFHRVRVSSHRAMGDMAATLFYVSIDENPVEKIREASLECNGFYKAQLSLKSRKVAREELHGIMKKAPDYLTDKGLKLFEIIKTYLDLPVYRVLTSFFSTKAQRAKALESVDADLARAYLAFTPTSLLEMAYDGLGMRDSFAFPGVSPEFILTYVEIDNMVYESIVNGLNEEPEKPKERPTTPEPVIVRPMKSYDLSAVIIGQDTSHYTPEHLKRIEFFVSEDVPQTNLSPEQVEELGASFILFNLYKHTRKRNERPTPLQFQTFFDDVYIDLLHGSIPSAQRMAELYEGAKTV